MIKNEGPIELAKLGSNQSLFDLCQSAYIIKITNDFGLVDENPPRTPLDVGYGKSNPSDLHERSYRQLIGRLLYFDISASVSILVQRISKPTQEDWNNVKRVVHDLKSTHQMELKSSNIQSKELSLFGYADASWADNKIERNPISDRIF